MRPAPSPQLKTAAENQLADYCWRAFDVNFQQCLAQGESSIDFVLELASFRLGIEPVAADLAARAKDPQSITLIEDAFRTLLECQHSSDASLEADIRFDTTILPASKSRFFLPFIPIVSAALTVTAKHIEDIRRSDGPCVDDHWAVVKAIRSGNARIARKQSEALIENSLEMVRRCRGEDSW